MSVLRVRVRARVHRPMYDTGPIHNTGGRVGMRRLQYGYLARVLHPEGTTLRVGEPIALVCDEPDELSHWAVEAEEAAGADGGGGGRLSLTALGVPTAAFDRSFSWQAYVKPADADGLGSPGSCGCG